MILLLLALTTTASWSDEIAFIARGGAYFTDSHVNAPIQISLPLGRSSSYGDLSPDGRFFLYISYTYKSYGEWYEIIAQNRWGEPIVTWFDSPGWPSVFIEAAVEAAGSSIAPRLHSPRWSSDASTILFARLNELIVLDHHAKYGEVVKEIPLISESDIIHYCDWAPNERYVVSTQRNEIWIADDSSEQLLGEGFNPDVSPDDTKIAFIVPGDGGEKSVWTMDLNGGNREHVHTYIQSVRASGSLIAWSPDSKEIAFFTPDGIRAVSLDGTVRNILDTEDVITAISWSPSGDTEPGTSVSPTSWGMVKRDHGRK